MQYPLMFHLGQKLENPTLGNVPEAIDAELSRLNLRSKVKAGETVAITCGSRGIANYAVIIKAVVDYFKKLNAKPFLIPAMGSHGGGTAEGQREMLVTLGIKEEVIGAEIRSSMETEIVGQLPSGVPVHCDKNALCADHTVVVNRVKLHTMFHNSVQSGLLKMMAMGLGKLKGAQLYHKAVEHYPFEEIARGICKVMLEKANILAGLMVVENSREQTARVQAALPEDFVEKEKSMLQYSRELFPLLPFKFIDILLVDEIGKIFSSFGADSNVTGRNYVAHAAARGEFPQIRTIVYRDLHSKSHGNAIGVGHAEFVRSRLVRKINAETTRLNSLTAGMPTLAAVPIDYETDREILDTALSLIGLTPREAAKIVWIRNTAALHEMECSEAYLEEAKHRQELSILSALHPLNFDPQGNLRDFVIGGPESPEVTEQEERACAFPSLGL
jgi:Lactate racemase N-terminal domain